MKEENVWGLGLGIEYGRNFLPAIEKVASLQGGTYEIGTDGSFSHYFSGGRPFPAFGSTVITVDEAKIILSKIKEMDKR
jgi:hypothetical protein